MAAGGGSPGASPHRPAAGELAAFACAPLAAPAPAPPGPIEGDTRAATLTLQAAEEQAHEIREQARAAGHAEGHQDGFAAGMAAAGAELAPIAAALEQALALQRERASDLVSTLERQAAELALRIAEKVVAGAIELEPQRVVDVVRAGLRVLIERERETVMVNPGDMELVRAATTELTGGLGGIAHLEVQAERRVDRGGAIIRTSEGEVDATLETKLDRVRELLLAEPDA